MKNYFNKLRELMNNSYSPYSDFQVAAIVVTTSGKEYQGVNVENASYGATLCAERNAISAAISQGVDGKEIIEIHLIGKPRESEKIPFTMPCGICRQFISEIVNDEAKIVVYKSKDEFQAFNKKELLPYAFTGDELEYES